MFAFSFTPFFLLLSFLLAPWVSYFNFSHIPAYLIFCQFSPLFCFAAYLTVASHGDSAAESVFASHLFCCSTSVKSEADVHLIKSNTIIINSCLHQLRHIDRGLAQQVAYFASDFRKTVFTVKTCDHKLMLEAARRRGCWNREISLEMCPCWIK